MITDSVANEARVAKAILYNHTELRERIETAVPTTSASPYCKTSEARNE
jgi:hypothetical protein